MELSPAFLIDCTTTNETPLKTALIHALVVIT
jgi:hypothetical protein